MCFFNNKRGLKSVDVKNLFLFLLQLKAPIDYDALTSDQFDVTVRVSDGTRSVNVQGSITVQPVNEHTPVFTQSEH